MIFYHFTLNAHIDAIRKEGLTLGVIPISINRYLKNYQWLTTNPDWFPAWSRGLSGKYIRTQWRITLTIPAGQRKNLLKWTDHGQRLMPLAMYTTLASEDTPDDWYVFHGRIPNRWFKEIEKRPLENIVNDLTST